MCVGNDAADEMGLGLVKGGHQVIQLAFEVGGDSFPSFSLLPLFVLGCFQGLAWVVSKALDGKIVASMLDHLHNGIVERVLVLLQPSSQVVGDSGGVMDDGKVRVGVGPWVRFGELGPLAQKVGHQLLGKGIIGGFWEKRLFLKDGEEGHGLLKHVNALLKIHPEVDVRPVQTLADIFFLL